MSLSPSDYNNAKTFKAFIQQVLPTVYDDSLSYSELLYKVLYNMNLLVENNNLLISDIKKLYDYTNDYFDNLNVQTEIDNKLEQMYKSGQLDTLFKKYLDPELEEQNQLIDETLNEQNGKIKVLESRMDTFSSLPDGSTAGNAELEDIRVGFNGIKYATAGVAVRTQIETLNNDLSSLTSHIKTGKNLFNKDTITKGYYISAEGPIASATLFYSDFIKITPNVEYCYSVISGLGGYFNIAKYDINKQLLGVVEVQVNEFTLGADGKRKYVLKTLDCEYIRVSTVTDDYAENLMVAKGNDYFYESWFWYWDDNTREEVESLIGISTSDYTLPYIDRGKLCCNSGKGVTAFYAGVDCEEKINAVWANFVFDDTGTSEGTAVVIINPIGIDSISNITDLSLHAQITPTRVKVDVLGNKYGEYYYQTLIQQTFPEPLPVDNVTETKFIMTVTESTNMVYVTVNDYEYSGKFNVTDDIPSISNVIGKYVSFEFYTNDMSQKSKMPKFTYTQARDVNNVYRYRDYFDRQNGVIQNAPTGQAYHLINNKSYNK